MAVAYSKWQINNRGHYVRMRSDTTELFAMDLVNQLDTTDQLIRAEGLADTGITLKSVVIRYDMDVRSTPHQILSHISADQPGVYGIELRGITQNGLTIVKHFDVLVER